MSKEKFITLKEAAKVSGYSPDYIGQLIRQGKIPGRLVYHNVAWVTTEEAVRDYVVSAKNKNKKNNASPSTLVEKLRSWKVRLEASFNPAVFMRFVFYVSAFIALLFFLLLFYVFSVGIDRKIEQGALEHVPAVQPPAENINFEENGLTF